MSQLDQPRPNPYAPPNAPQNPYAPPTAPMGAAAAGAPSNAAAIRREHIKHETSVRSVGLLYYLNGAIIALYTVLFAFATVATLVDGAGGASAVGMAVATLFCGALAALLFWLGSSLRRLEERSRMPTTILSVIGLLGIPIGTLISAYILYLLHSEKGKRIFTAEYRAIRDRTPEIRYKTPLLVWIVVGLLLVGLAVLIAMVVAG